MGRRPVPRRRLELGPARPVADRPALPEHRRHRGQHADLHLLGQRHHRDPRRHEPAAQRSDQRRHPRHLPEHDQGVRRQSRAPDLLRPRQLRRRPPEHGAVQEQPEPLRPEGRLFGRVRQALLQGRRRGQLQPEERGRLRLGLRRVAAIRRCVWRWGRGQHDRQRPRGHLAEGHALQRRLGGLRRPLDPAALAGRRGVRGRLMEAPSARDAGPRRALLPLREPLRPRRHDLELGCLDLRPGPR